MNKKKERELISNFRESSEFEVFFDFFEKYLHFKPVVVRRKRRFRLYFIPIAVTYDNGSTSSWSSFDTRYERDFWSNGFEDISITFDCVDISVYGHITLLCNNKTVAEINQRVLGSARIRVFSRTEYDRHANAKIYFEPTNPYTYAEFKDKSYIDNIHSLEYPNEIQSGRELAYFIKNRPKKSDGDAVE